VTVEGGKDEIDDSDKYEWLGGKAEVKERSVTVPDVAQTSKEEHVHCQ